MSDVLRWTLTSASSEIQVTSICHLMASVVNKRANGESSPGLFRGSLQTEGSLIDLKPFLGSLEQDLWSYCASSAAQMTTEQKRAITAWIWVSPVANPMLRVTRADRIGSWHELWWYETMDEVYP